MFSSDTLPSHYGANVLTLMVQSPQVLYAYWELSPSQRAALAKKKKLQLRLNIVNRGVYRVYDIEPYWDSFYFTGVEPGLEYYCDISVIDGEKEPYPIIYSNTVSTPSESRDMKISKAPSSDFWATGEHIPRDSSWFSVSSEAYYKK